MMIKLNFSKCYQNHFLKLIPNLITFSLNCRDMPVISVVIIFVYIFSEIDC